MKQKQEKVFSVQKVSKKAKQGFVYMSFSMIILNLVVIHSSSNNNLRKSIRSLKRRRKHI